MYSIYDTQKRINHTYTVVCTNCGKKQKIKEYNGNTINVRCKQCKKENQFNIIK